MAGSGGALSLLHGIPRAADAQASAKTRHGGACIYAYEYISCYYSLAVRFQVATERGGKSHNQYSCTSECQLKADNDKKMGSLSLAT